MAPAAKKTKVVYVGGMSDGVIVAGEHVASGGEIAVEAGLAAKLLAGGDFAEPSSKKPAKKADEAEEADK